MAVQSPQDLSATAYSALVAASSSSDNLGGNTIAGIGDTFRVVTPSKKRAVTEGITECWLTYDFVDVYGNVVDLSPNDQLFLCIYLVTRSIAKHGTILGQTVGLQVPDALAVQPGAVLSSAANRGCRELAIPIDVRTRKGKLLSIGKAKHATLSASSVRYSCSVSGGTVKITIKGHKSLRTSLGERLHLMVLRAKKAPPASGTLTFTFGR